MHSTGPTLLSRVRPAHWLVLDYVAAGAYAVPTLLLLVNVASGTAGALAVPAELMAFTLPVALRRHRPVLAIGILLVGLSVVGLGQPDAVLLGLLPLTYVLYIVAAVCRPRTALFALAASLCAAVGTALPDFRHLGAAIPFAFLYLVVWVVGYAIGQHRRYTADLLGYQARLAEAEREDARRTVVQERIQIARELHDVVAHGMSVITVQAGYGTLVMDTDPDAARSALGAIEATGRQTLTELRTLLTVLRQDEVGEEPGALALAPAPGLGCLDELLERTAKAGVQTAFTVTGRIRPLPAGVDLAAYRIVQEALTNVVKHAQTSVAEVGLDYGEDGLTIDVTDDGNGCPDGMQPVPGHGLIGIRERAQLYGGSVHAHTRPGGGFTVACRIPVLTDTRESASAVTATTSA